MPKFRVVAGTYRTVEGEQAEAGDVVDIEESVYERHPETFAPVEQAQSSEPPGEGYSVETSDGADREDEPEPESEPEAESETAPSAEIPDEYGMLSSMAAEYEGDEIHGAMSGDDITEFLETLSDTELNALKRQALTDEE